MKQLPAAPTGLAIRMSRFLRLTASTAAVSCALHAVPAVAAEPRRLPLESMGGDLSVRAGDDFFTYANGGWIKTHAIPADQASWGVFQVLRDDTIKSTIELIGEAAKSNAPAGSDTRKIGDFYASFMEEAAIEARGLAPLKPDLARIAAITDQRTLARVLGASLRADVDPLNNTNFFTENLFGLWTAPGFTDPEHYDPYLLQGGLGMPDRHYYLADDPKMNEARAAYKAHIAAVLRLAGIAGRAAGDTAAGSAHTDADTRAARILDLETRIARVHASRADSEDVLKANNPWARADFAQRAPGLDWSAFFGAAGLSGQPTITVWQPGAVTGIAAIVAATPIEVWKDYLAFHLLNRTSPYLPKAFVDERFAFYGRVLSGTPRLRDRSKRGVDAVNSALGDAVGRLYVARHFSPQAKLTVETMVQNIMAAFGRRIDHLDWMSPQTKARAKEKLGTLYVGIGYPEKSQDYRALQVVRGDVVRNVTRAELFEYRRQLTRLGQAVDRGEWAMTPQTVNAVNLPLQNAINFPAAMLQPPFFDPHVAAAYDYGAIGAVIGHEISHSFDDQGSQFDAHGRLADWWTQDDLAHFKAAAAQLVAQFNTYRPFPDLAVNGQTTLSENLADLAGLTAAFDGWRASIAGSRADSDEVRKGEQLFFVAYSQSRRQRTRDAALRQQVLTDGHAPARYRALAVRNIDAWYSAFGVQATDKLYLAPAERVRIW